MIGGVSNDRGERGVLGGVSVDRGVLVVVDGMFQWR